MPDKHILNCKQCGNEFEATRKRKYCGEGCYPSNFTERYQSIAKRISNCSLCGNEFETHVKGRKYCSRRCNLTAWRQNNPCARGPHPNVTRVVREFKRIARRRSISLRKQGVLRRRANKRRSRLDEVCAMCAVSLAGQYHARKYCDSCRPEAAKRIKRVHKARRRALEVTTQVECIDPIDIFIRDGYRCHLCGGMTLKDKRGSYHPRAPELDHIIPLSKGGPHRVENVACSCRECNGSKGEKIIGQPSLLELCS